MPAGSHKERKKTSSAMHAWVGLLWCNVLYAHLTHGNMVQSHSYFLIDLNCIVSVIFDFKGVFGLCVLGGGLYCFLFLHLLIKVECGCMLPYVKYNPVR